MLDIVDHAFIIIREGECIESLPTMLDCENVARRWSINHPEVYKVYQFGTLANRSGWELVSTWASGRRHFKAKAKGTI